ncbi:hypothetical protein [Halopiger djelfimassiliensis]|uniref:hypothetical protein n=1 Tax=Halopiger djelfimassiliensis TaxID=1293047 RepID=UPI0006779CFD|nr:hypothetical protein [Halopiger djelfimassiliensis]
MSEGYKAAELADQLRDGDVEANLESVLSDDPGIGDVLLACERADLDKESPLYDMLARQTATDALRDARRSGDVATMNAATGLSESRVEATGYDMLVSALKPAAQQLLIKGPKGSGKTTKALDLARHLHAEFGGELSVLTNIRGPDEHDDVEYADTLSGMLEWVRDTDGEKLVIGDEWSSTVNAHAHGGGEVRASFSRFINALRKGEGGSTRLIVIGHEHDTDIAAIVRNQSDVVLEADGKVDEGLIDCATVYEGWTDYQRGEPWIKIRGMRDVPESSAWGADTNYFATFELDLDYPAKQIRKGKLIEDWEQYQDDEDADDAGNSAKDYRSCRGEKTDGTDCGATVKHESGYCHAHRSQWDGEPDPRLKED